MAAIQTVCPGCGLMGQILQPMPGPLKCPRCGTLFQVTAPGPLTSAPPPPAAPAPPSPRTGAKALAWTGLAGLLVGGIVLVVYCFWEPAEPTSPGDVPIKPTPSVPILTEEQKRILEEQRKVNEAVAKGVAYLKRKIQDTETLHFHPGIGTAPHTGAMALVGLTLLECGVPPDDPAVLKALEIVQSAAPRLTFNYALATSILFLDQLDDPKERKGPPRYDEQIRSLALRLITGQNDRGGWSYACRLLTPEQEEQLLHDLRSKTYRPGPFVRDDDNSNVQFATLALWVARKHGVPADPALALVEARYRKTQNPDGSWGYRPKTRMWSDSMTCAGLLGLAVGLGLKDHQSAANDPAVTRGFQYLNKIVGTSYRVSAEEAAVRQERAQAEMDITKRFPSASVAERKELLKEFAKLNHANLKHGLLIDADAWGDHYFLWSLQRTAMIYDLKRIVGKDWYAWGSQILVASQQPDGSWADRFPGIPDTCFALLFLKRVNLVKDLTDKLRALGPAGGIGATPGQQGVPPGKKG